MKKNITNIVEKLASHESYKDLYHEHRYGVPLPSNEVLLQIIDLLRGIVFPGYYGTSSINTDTLEYHIGHILFMMQQKYQSKYRVYMMLD